MYLDSLNNILEEFSVWQHIFFSVILKYMIFGVMVCCGIFIQNRFWTRVNDWHLNSTIVSVRCFAKFWLYRKLAFTEHVPRWPWVSYAIQCICIRQETSWSTANWHWSKHKSRTCLPKWRVVSISSSRWSLHFTTVNSWDVLVAIISPLCNFFRLSSWSLWNVTPSYRNYLFSIIRKFTSYINYVVGCAMHPLLLRWFE